MSTSKVLIGANHYPRGEGIYRCQLDLDTGELTDLELSAEVENASFLALTKDHRRLYCVSETMRDGRHVEGAIYAFELNPSTGELFDINRQPSGGACPVHLSLDPSETCLLVANYVGGSIASYPILENGAIGECHSLHQLEGSSIHPKRQRQAHAHSIYTDSKGEKVYVCDLGSDKLWIYDFDRGAAKIEPAKTPFVSSKTGSGPRHLAFHQNGKRIFVLNELASTISVFEFTGLRDFLSLRQTISTLPETFDEQSTCAEVIVSPDQKYIYASNRGHDSIAVFTWNETAEKLELTGRTPTNGQHPRNFTLDSTGQFALVANLRSDNVVSFHIDPDNGKLEPTGFSIEVPNPICVRSLPVT